VFPYYQQPADMTCSPPRSPSSGDQYLFLIWPEIRARIPAVFAVGSGLTFGHEHLFDFAVPETGAPHRRRP